LASTPLKKEFIRVGRVQDKVAIITGASGGIGSATAKLLAREGAKVVLTDIDDEYGKQVAAEINGNGGDAVYHHLDVTLEDDWARVMDETIAQYGFLNVLVNNAIGDTEIEEFEEAKAEQWRRLLAVALEGVFFGTHFAIPLMRKAGGGSIVNISSGAGFVGTPRLATYSAAKGGVRLFSKSIAVECAMKGDNIRVNSLHPGFILTPPMQERGATLFPGLDEEEAFKAMASAIPVQRLGRAEEIAYGILFLASDEASYVTGAELAVDGGFTAQ
jgi:NAD(P)-dependent dehydrogenase (short-subunit alcohol dehydrogenase family)